MSTITTYPYLFAGLFLLVILGIGLCLVWIAEKSPARHLFHSCAGIVAPHAGLLALLFGLFAAFLANDVSIHGDRARAAVSHEASAITTVLSIADALAERGQTLKHLAISFGEESAARDWSSAPETADADKLGLAMLHEVLFGGLAGVDPEVRRAAVTSIMDMRSSRSEMSAVAHSRTSGLKWIAAFFLGILTMMGVVVVQLGKPRATMLAVTLFSVGMGFVLWVILMRINPYAGVDPVSLAPIKAAYMPFVAR